MERFLYVFDSKTCDDLVNAGYQLLKSDKKNNVYVFVNRMEMAFELSDITFVRSDKLTF